MQLMYWLACPSIAHPGARPQYGPFRPRGGRSPSQPAPEGAHEPRAQERTRSRRPERERIHRPRDAGHVAPGTPRPLRPRGHPDDDRDRDEPSRDRAHRRRALRVRAPLVPPAGLHLQVLRVRDGLPLHERDRQEHDRGLQHGVAEMATLVRARDHDHPVRAGPGGPPHRRGRRPLLRGNRGDGPPHLAHRLRTHPRRGLGGHHPPGALQGGRGLGEDPRRDPRGLDARRLPG